MIVQKGKINVYVKKNEGYINIFPESSISYNLTSYLKLNQSHYFGRENDIVLIFNQIRLNDRPLIINGMGGIGKSTVAQLFINKFRRKYSYFLFLSCQTNVRSTIVENIQLVTSLGLQNELNSLKSGKNYYEDAFWYILDKLKKITTKLSKPNLIILDNYTSTKENTKYLMHICNTLNWKVLICSREIVADFDVFELDFLSQSNLNKLYRFHCKKSVDDSILNEIFNLVGNHTLSVELLAKLSNSIDDLNPEELLVKLKENGLILSNETLISSNYDKLRFAKTTFIKCINIAFTLYKSRLNSFDENILMYFTFLPDSEISYSDLLILNYISDSERYKFQNSLIKLTSYGWLSCNLTENTTFYNCHKVIKETIRLSLIKKGKANISSLINNITVVTKLNITTDQSLIFSYSRYFSFFENIVKTVKFSKVEHSIIFENLSKFYREQGIISKSLEYALKSLNLIKNNTKTSNDIELSDSYENLSLIYWYLLDDLKTALKFQKDCVKCRENISRQISDLSDSYNNLSLIYHDLKNKRKSLEFQCKAITVAENDINFDKVKLAIYYSNLARIYSNLFKKHSIALQYVTKSIKIYKSLNLHKHPYYASAFCVLSSILKNLNKLNWSLNALKIAEDIEEKALSPLSISKAKTFVMIADILFQMKKYEYEKEYLLKAYEIYFHNKHPFEKEIKIRITKNST